MILNEEEAKERYESPLNLLNRLRTSLSPTSKTPIVSIPPTADQIVENLDEKVKAVGLKTKAAGIMSDCLDEIKKRLEEVQKPTQLAQVAETMHKIVNAEDKNKKENELDKPQFIVYSPTFINEEHFDTIYVRE